MSEVRTIPVAMRGSIRYYPIDAEKPCWKCGRVVYLCATGNFRPGGVPKKVAVERKRGGAYAYPVHVCNRRAA